MLDISTLTIGEIAKIEDLSGQAVSALENDETPKGLLLGALVFVFKRRGRTPEEPGDPTFKWNQALATPLTEAQEYLGIGDDEDGDVDEPEDVDEEGDVDEVRTWQGAGLGESE